jgi:GR25 family glycosyltransferase involved in LPS biosynthesis
MELQNIIAYYINLDFRTDRNHDVKEKLNKLGFNEKNINRFSAIDGKNLSNELNNKGFMGTKILELVKNANIQYKSTELAVLLSHYFLLQQIIQNPNINEKEFVFVFEDDFFINEKYLDEKPFIKIIEEIKCFNALNETTEQLTEQSTKQSTKQSIWDILFLGGRFKVGFIPTSINNTENFQKIDENFYLRVKKGKPMDWDRTLHNYVINKKSAIKLCEIIENNFVSGKIINQIDHLFCNDSNGLKSFDYFPHIFYSPINYTTDIQFSRLYIKTGNI